MGENSLTVADALALRNNGNNGGFLGDGSAWWVIILILLFAGGNWGNNRGGNNDGGTNTVIVPTGGNFGGGWGGYTPCCAPATQQGMTDAFNFNALSNGIASTHDSVIDGFYQNNLATTSLGTAMQTGFGQAALQSCQGFNGVTNAMNAGFNTSLAAMNNGFNTVSSALCNGFNGVQAAIADSNYRAENCCCQTREAIMQTNFNNQTGFNNVVTALNTNACDIERGQDDIRYLMAQNQNATLVGIDRLGDRIIDYMTQSKMDELRTELQNARFQISQSAQTEQLLGALQPISRPAYITASPYQSLAYNGVNGCGCGNF
jgi:hypothetical protein